MSPQSNSEQCRDSREQPKTGACLYSFHLHLSSFLQQFLSLCVLHRGHSLLPFALYQNRGRRFARVGLFAIGSIISVFSIVSLDPISIHLLQCVGLPGASAPASATVVMNTRS